MKIVRILSFLTLLVGLIALAVRIADLFSYHYITSKVISVDPYQGECRRPSGRYEQCLLYHVRVGYQSPDNAGTKLEGVIDAGEKGVSIVPGDELRVAVKKDDPTKVSHPELREGWKLALGMFMISFLLWIISSALGSRAKPVV